MCGYARFGGAGHPIVLVHGLAVSSLYFVPLAKRLARSFTVLAPDLPGYGRSATPPRPLDVPELARALRAWLDLAGIESAIVLGNSLGCQIAVELALQSPLRVASLVLVGPTMDPGAPTIRRQSGALSATPFVSRSASTSSRRATMCGWVRCEYSRRHVSRLQIRSRRSCHTSCNPPSSFAANAIRSCRRNGRNGRRALTGWTIRRRRRCAARRSLGGRHAVAGLVEEFQQELGEFTRPFDHRHVTDAGQHREP